jgi:hypothetical protein
MRNFEEIRRCYESYGNNESFNREIRAAGQAGFNRSNPVKPGAGLVVENENEEDGFAKRFKSPAGSNPVKPKGRVGPTGPTKSE